MKVLFVAGGSGGHIIPALAVADALRAKFPNAELLFISSRSELDAEVFAAHSFSYQREQIATGKFRRYFDLQNFIDPFRFLAGIWQALRILKRERPDVIFSKGGFVALPVGIAAKLRGVPLVIHESDVVSGLTNRILKRLAAQVLTTFPAEQGIWVGTPVRAEIFRGDSERGRKFLGFSEDIPILLVMGGSQGAETINQLLLHALPALTEKICVVHLSGSGKSADKDHPRYRAFPYLGQEFPDVLAAADLIFSRAGANTLFELAAAKKPVMLLPLTSAANNHQVKNAAYFAEKGAAKVFFEENFTSADFQRVVLEFLADTDFQAELRKNVASLARPEAAEKIAEILVNFEK